LTDFGDPIVHQRESLPGHLPKPPRGVLEAVIEPFGFEFVLHRILGTEELAEGVGKRLV
jgi:hypothetical protein